MLTLVNWFGDTKINKLEHPINLGLAAKHDNNEWKFPIHKMMLCIPNHVKFH